MSGVGGPFAPLSEEEESLCMQGIAGRGTKVICKGWPKHEKGTVWWSPDDVCLNSRRQQVTQSGPSQGNTGSSFKHTHTCTHRKNNLWLCQTHVWASH